MENAKWIGLLGGMSIESSIEYERMITQLVRQTHGEIASPRMIHLSVNFAEIEALQESGDWETCARLMVDGAKRLELAGAEVIVLCTNTMHIVAQEISDAVKVPFIHLADATAESVKKRNVKVVGLLGTRHTMEKDFYRDRLEANGLKVLIPEASDRSVVHNVIFEELVKGIITEKSRLAFKQIAERLVEQGAEGIIAGCTEIESLLKLEDLHVPYFPTARIHAAAVANLSGQAISPNE
mmetsp:Transcript_6392/g.11806  ORF Transcript_6392/g.11806 Transcript_6392/m.11806 type:complete len:239 (+) Transcript_6392:176-892(+)